MSLVMQCLLNHATDAAYIHSCNNLIKRLRKNLLKRVSFDEKMLLFSQNLIGRIRYTQSHTRTRATKQNDGARAAVPQDASYVWRDRTCYRCKGHFNDYSSTFYTLNPHRNDKQERTGSEEISSKIANIFTQYELAFLGSLCYMCNEAKADYKTSSFLLHTEICKYMFDLTPMLILCS